MSGSATPMPVPPSRYIPADLVIREMSEFGRHRIEGLSAPKILTLGVMGGAFITAGALFSILLAVGIETDGVRHLVEGFAFSSGFFFVVLSEAALFTEANVVMPATLLAGYRPPLGWPGSGGWPSSGTSSGPSYLAG